MIEEYERVEQERRRLRAEELTRKEQERAAAAAAAAEAGEGDGAAAVNPLAEEDSASEDEGDDKDDVDEMKYAESADMAGSKVDSKERISVRNLRIREDTAKYLLNLDPNSAYYDPKTRSMRGNPLAGTSKTSDYAGDNFVRYTGDVSTVAERQLFAWEAAEKGKGLFYFLEMKLDEFCGVLRIF